MDFGLRRAHPGAPGHVARVHGRARLPGRGHSGRAGRRARRRSGAPLVHAAGAGGAERGGAPSRPVESLPAGRARCGSDQPAVRPARRDQRAQSAARTRGHELLRAGHGEHGGSRHVRHAGPAPPVARAAAGGTDPVRLLHDRAGRRQLGRHQHHGADRTGRRRVRRHRPQVVVDRRDEPELPAVRRPGHDGPGRAPAPPAVDGPGPPGRPRGARRAGPERLRLRRRRPRRARGGGLRPRPGPGGEPGRQ